MSDDGDIYIGETVRLFRRWNEHQTGRGGEGVEGLVGIWFLLNPKGKLCTPNRFRILICPLDCCDNLSSNP